MDCTHVTPKQFDDELVAKDFELALARRQRVHARGALRKQRLHLGLRPGVARVEERFGVQHVADVLTGAKTDMIRRCGHDQLSTYDLLSEFSKCGNIHWADSTDANLLPHALRIGFIIFADSLQAGGSYVW